MKPIENLMTVNGRCMTRIDFLLNIAINTARKNGLPYKNIVPKRDKGRIVGYYILNEGLETTVATIE